MLKFGLSLFFAAFFAFFLHSSTAELARFSKNYCNNAALVCFIEHTACEYGLIGPPASRCNSKLSKFSLTEAEERLILKVHNDLREKVASGQEPKGNPGPQPPAKNGLPKLKWDKELALTAQRWADQCLDAIGGCRNTDRFYVARSFVMVKVINNFSYKNLIMNEWYNTVEYMSPDQVVNFMMVTDDNVDLSPYANMMLENTTLIGCGTGILTNMTGKYISLACNYQVQQKYIGGKIYEIL